MDFVAYDSRGEVVLLAEAKTRSGTSDQWASQLRRNILAHGDLPVSPFFLVVTLDGIYLWGPGSGDRVDSAPDAVADPNAELATYLESLGWPEQKISPPAFELLVLSWLRDLADGADGSRTLALAETGFPDRLRGAVIQHQAEWA